jgi:hypothetical protein
MTPSPAGAVRELALAIDCYEGDGGRSSVSYDGVDRLPLPLGPHSPFGSAAVQI